jgi:hypothetical protein
MTTKQNKSQSPFAQAALDLDRDFTQFERLAREIERLSVNSDRGLERAGIMMGEIDAVRKRLETGMVALAKTLDDARERTEKAALTVSNRAQEIRERQLEAENMLTRYKTLGEMVKQITTALTQLRKPGAGEMTPEDQATLAKRLPEFNAQMDVVVNEARKLMDDAHQANMKTLERNADSLRQSLQAARNRFNIFVEKSAGGSSPTLQ